MRNPSPVRRMLALSVAIVAGFALAPAAALADFAPTNVEVTPETTAAGSNSDLRIQFGFSDADEQVKDLIVSLPPGLIGNPTVPEVCTQTQLDADACPANSQVGTVTSGVNAYPTPATPVPLTVEGSIYNFTPQPGEPARFGIVLRPAGGLTGTITLQSGVRLRSDFGLDTVLEDLPTESNGLRTDITSMDLTLNGTVNGGGFIRKPTSCDSHDVVITANSYATPDSDATASDAFTTTGCELLPFTPEFAAFAKTDGPDDRSVEVTTQIKQTLDEAGLKTAKVILPQSFGANQERLAGENLCSQAEFAAGDCPERSIVGSAVAETPVLDDPIAGDVTVVDPEADTLPLLGLDLRGPLNLQLLGQFVLETPPDAPRVGTGVRFDGLPDIPISNFELTFDGDGDDSLTQSAFDICDPDMVPAFDLTFDSYAGETTPFSQPAETECGGGPPVGGSKARAKLTGGKRPALQLGARSSAGIDRVTFRTPKALRFTTNRRSITARTGQGEPARFAVSRNSIVVRASNARALRVRVKNAGLRLKQPAQRIRGEKVGVKINSGGALSGFKVPIR